MSTELRQLRLRYAAVCAICRRPLAPGSNAWWDGTRKQAQCIEHVSSTVSHQESSARDLSPADAEDAAAPGLAGASAQREFERRRGKREERIRANHPHIGGLILALTNDPQSTRAWAIGADGERELGKRFDEIAARGGVALHDRRMPGTRANIDHIVVAPAGVFVVDAKKYRGKVEKRDVGGFLKKDERLFVGRRDCSKFLDGMHKQLRAVRAVMETRADLGEVPVGGSLCFVGAEWSLFARPIQLDGVTVTWPKALVQTFEARRVLSPEQVTAVAAALAERLPPA